eukprot:216349-Amphidinium_carterae.1
MGGKTGPTKNPKNLHSWRKSMVNQGMVLKRSRLSRPLTPSLLEVQMSGWGGPTPGGGGPYTETPEQLTQAKVKGLGAPAQMPQWWKPKGDGGGQLNTPALKANRL